MSDKPLTPLGRMLRLYRAHHDLTVRQLAPAIGISHATLSRIERGGDCDVSTFLALVGWMQGSGAMSLPAFAPIVNDPRLLFFEDEHRYVLDGRDLISVTTALKEAGMVDMTHWQESARLRGQYVHSAIALFNEDALELSALDPALVPYFDGYLQFRSDTGVVVEHSETRVCDPVLGYAGTLDLIVRWPEARYEKRTLIDAKTGSFPPMAGPQTAAYLRCARAWYPTGTLIARAGLHLPGDGTYRLIEFNDIVQDESDFMAALRVAQFRRRHGIV